MNNISHHLSDATISEYASGTLEESLEVVVACHLTLCPHCREKSIAADEVGGYFLETAEPLKPDMGATELLKTLSQTHPQTQPLTQSSSADASEKRASAARDFGIEGKHGIPQPLARRLEGNFEELNWKMLAKGIQQYDLAYNIGQYNPSSRFGLTNTKPVNREQKKPGAFKLLKLQPGTELIEHTHGDHELTMILQGSYSDALGRFGVGDVADLGPDVDHKPIVDSDVPCIALIATNSPARYKGILGRLIQPFVGI